MKKRNHPLLRSPIALAAMALVLCAVIFLAALLSPTAAPVTERSLAISEVMSSNASYPDAHGVCADWIEIRNEGEREESLAGLILTDDKDRAKFVFGPGTVLKAGEYLVVYCLSSVENSAYAGFGLASSGGEQIVLMTEKGEVLSEVTTFSLKSDQSMIREGGRWLFCDAPSPGFANTPEGHALALQAAGEKKPLESELTLEITEVMSSNGGAFFDADGDASDWLEITNTGNETVSLQGLGITTSESDPFSWRIEAERSLAPGESLVIFASGKNRNGEGELHTDFRLSAEGETLWLFDPSACVADQCTIPALEENQVYQKVDGAFSLSFAMTPGKSGAMSETERKRYENKLVIHEVCASYRVGRGGGFDRQSDWLEIKNVSSESLDLTGCFLSDDGIAQGTPLTGTLPAGGILLLWADGENAEGHCDFSLSSSGEALTLYTPWKTEICSLSYPSLAENCSYAMNADGSYSQSVHPTPGFENTPEGLESWYASQPPAAGLVINELMSDNFALLPQSYGETFDWIEIQNRGNTPVSLSGCSLSEERGKAGVLVLPDVTLAPGECYVVLASGKPQLTNKNYLHAPFKLSSEGGALFLFAPDGSLADALSFGPIPVGASYGRDGKKSGWSYFEVPTPGKANGEGKRLVSAAPRSLTSVGAHEGVERVEVKLSGEGSLYYTLDGSVPTSSSQRYTESFFVSKTTVVRAFCSVADRVDSEVKSFTYLLNEGHTLPVVSVSTAPANLWDENTGIYVKGPNAAAESPYRGANFYKDWERAANVSYYDPAGAGFSVDCGLKIFGNTGRALDKKSFQLKFKSQYGCSKLCYDLFENTPVNLFDSLVLRSGSQDYVSTLLRDAVVSELCSQGMPETEAQDYRYCVLYLNGEYWGVYCIREKLDEDFVAGRYCVDPDSVNVLGYTGVLQHGSNKDYKALVNYARSHDLSVTEHYEYVKERLSLESYVDWFIAQAYVGNSDLDNVRFFSTTDGDGKWRWILYDFDLTFYRSNDPYSYLISSSAYYSDVSTLMRELMKNENFRDFFLKRFAYQLSTTFSEENVRKVIGELKNSIAAEMPRERSRWKLSYSSWENAVKKLESFVLGEDGVGRSEEIINDICVSMNLSKEERAHYFG